MMLAELSDYIKQNVAYIDLPSNLQGFCGNSPAKYGELIIDYNFSNQRSYDHNLVQTFIRKEDKYYSLLLENNCKNLLIYPYHLSPFISKFAYVDPAEYYISMLEYLLSQTKSYDIIPNFTAADILQLLSVGRNQYIDIVLKCKPTKSWMFKKTSLRQFLTKYPKLWPACSDWWSVRVSYVTVNDITNCSTDEKAAIDDVIDMRKLHYNYFKPNIILELYKKSLIWFDITVEDTDHFSVPTLENFVMNRVQGDYMETTMYKVFISIDEHTTVSELAVILSLDIGIVKNAISLFCRLGLCCKIDANNTTAPHVGLLGVDNESTVDATRKLSISNEHGSSTLSDGNVNLIELSPNKTDISQLEKADSLKRDASVSRHKNEVKRIGLFFDSSLSAFLMMGNLSSGLKSYAVTMYEVGKLTNESMNSFISELSNMKSMNEGDAHVYYLHAVNLLHTLKTLRKSSNLKNDPNNPEDDLLETDGIDMLSTESFCSLDDATRLKILQKRYSILISIAPLLPNIMCITTYSPYNFGPCIPEIKTPWYRFFLYSLLKNGPYSLFLPKGYVLSCLPEELQQNEELLITPYRSESTKVKTDGALMIINGLLESTALMTQSFKPFNCTNFKLVHVPFPFDFTTEDSTTIGDGGVVELLMDMSEKFNLNLCFGYVTLAFVDRCLGHHDHQENGLPAAARECCSIQNSAEELYSEKSSNVDLMMSGMVVTEVETLKTWNGSWIPLDICYGIALFDTRMNMAICDKIKSRNLFHKTNLEKYTQVTRLQSIELTNFMKTHQAIRGQSPHQDDHQNNHFNTETLPTHPILFNGTNTIQWRDPLIDNHILDYLFL